MADLEYAKVTGRFGLTVGDTINDVDDDPDIVWCDGGRVLITPLNTFVKVAGAAAGPFTAGAAVIEAQIGPDGRLLYQGKNYLYVVDLTSPTVNPQIPAGKATHKVTFTDVTAGTTRVNFPEFTCRLVAAGDGISLGGANDLTIVAPVVPGAASPIYRGEQGTSVASLAVQGTNLIATLSDGTSVDAGVLPVGPGGSDAGVAGYASTAGSQTRTAIKAIVASDTPTLALPRWQPNTAYTAGYTVLAPDGSVVKAKADFTSGATYNAANWTSVATTPGTQAAADLSASYGRGVSVVTTGALGDGTTDDTAAIHAARDAAGSNGVVYFPKGTYLTTGLIATKTNQTWIFESGATVTAKAGATINLINLQSAGGRIVGGTFDGNRANQTTNYLSVIQITADDCSVVDTTVRNSKFHGIYVRNCNRATIQRNLVTATNSDGIYVEADANATADIFDHKILNNRVDRSAETAATVLEGCIKVHGNPTSGKRPRRSQIIGNTCLMPTFSAGSQGADGSAICLEVMYGADGTVVQGNSTDGGIMGISISGFDPIGGSARVVVSGNTVRNFSYYGIEWANAKRGTCSGNTIDGSGIGLVGIAQSQAVSTYLACSSNHITGFTQDGIAINAPFAVVSGNTINVPSAARHAVQVSASNVSVHGNAIDSTSTTGYGISLTNGCSFVSIIGNVLHGNSVAKKGIAADRPPLGFTCIGNTIHDWTEHGILVYGSTAVTLDSVAVVGNTYRSVAATFGTQFSGGTTWGTRVLFMDSETGLVVKQGGLTLPATTKTASYTATANDSVIFASGAGVTITLPGAATAGLGRHYKVKNTGASAVTIASASGNVEGAATASLAAGASATYVSDSANWWAC